MRRFAVSCLVLCACGSTAPAIEQAALPPSQDVASLRGEKVECSLEGRSGKPLIIDWAADRRLELEAAMKNGAAVIRYHCDEPQILDRCELPGTYEYAGVSVKEEVVRLENQRELEVNLPLGAASFASAVRDGSRIDLALAWVGKTSVGWQGVTTDDLTGACDGATHVVRSTYLGAFALGQSAANERTTAAEVFGAGASESSGASRELLQKDGDVAACRGADPKAKSPPVGCAAPLRLELRPVVAGTDEPTIDEAPPRCPDDMVFAAGRCTTDRSTPHDCGLDPSACRTQCEQGDLYSCYREGMRIADFQFGSIDLQGNPVPQEEALALFEKACKGGVVEGCTGWGRLIAGTAGRSIEERRAAWARADELFEAPCLAGHAEACFQRSAARLPSMQMIDDRDGFFAFARRGCELGLGRACMFEATALTEGIGTAEDRQAAIQVLRRACHAGHVPACRKALAGKPDPAMVKRACRLDPESCPK